MTSTATRRSVKWTNRRGTHTASLGTYGQPGALDLIVAGDPVAVSDGNTGEEIAATIPGAELTTWQEARKAALATAATLLADLEEFAR
jgi:hypothetical protein